MYFLDTNVIIDIIRRKNPSLIGHFCKVHCSDIVVPSIVIAELEYGARHSGDYENNKRQYSAVTKNFRIIPFNEKEAEIYGLIRQNLASKGNIIGPNDLLIASIVLANNGVLVTHNVSEFCRVPDLQVEDWTS